MQDEGEEWTYYQGDNRAKYVTAMQHSIAYVLLDGDKLCGYGRSLMKTICDLYPEDIVYVTSDVDVYYEKLGCEKEGTVFIVKL